MNFGKWAKPCNNTYYYNNNKYGTFKVLNGEQ